MHLVVTHCDEVKGEWHMLMPKELRESLAADLPFFLDCAMKGVKAPSAKELRMMAAVRDFFGGAVNPPVRIQRLPTIRTPAVHRSRGRPWAWCRACRDDP